MPILIQYDNVGICDGRGQHNLCFRLFRGPRTGGWHNRSRRCGWLFRYRGGFHGFLGFDRRIRCRTLLAENHRLTIYDGADWGELYDLRQDPHELQNLWDVAQSAQVRARLLERLSRAMLSHIDSSPYPTALA